MNGPASIRRALVWLFLAIVPPSEPPVASALLAASMPVAPPAPLPERSHTGFGRCYIALLHGSGPDLTARGGAEAPLMEKYWNPAADPTYTMAAQATRVDLVASHCTLARIGFDGGSAWWSERAAGIAARALHDFIEAEHIPDGKLLLVGHSMGGLVARYIVNNGAETAPYHNEYQPRDARMDYGLVRRKAAAILTVATPHTGSEGADALHGLADHAFSNAGATVLQVLGMVRDSPANASLGRAVLEGASEPGGDMDDEGRTVPIFTVAATRVEPLPNMPRTRADRRLAMAWDFLCARSSVFNLWGLACGHAAHALPTIIGDGVVSRASAHGSWTRDRGERSPIPGVWIPYRDIPVNHSQSRYVAQTWRLIAPLIDTLDLRVPVPVPSGLQATGP